MSSNVPRDVESVHEWSSTLPGVGIGTLTVGARGHRYPSGCTRHNKTNVSTGPRTKREEDGGCRSRWDDATLPDRWFLQGDVSSVRTSDYLKS